MKPVGSLANTTDADVAAADPLTAPLIEFRGVTKKFGARTILESVDLQIYEGQVTTIIGLSGSGKSVLLKHIIGC